MTIIVDKSYFNKIKKYNAPSFFSMLVSDCFGNNQIVKEINI